jgi:uncharacterized protein
VYRNPTAATIPRSFRNVTGAPFRTDRYRPMLRCAPYQNAWASDVEAPYQHCVGHLKFIHPQKGWGVVAGDIIQAGETVEVAPIIRLFRSITDQHLNLKHRVFDWAALGGRVGETALALGYGSMYNHGNPANLSYRALHNGSASALVFTAARDIAAGEELTINYNDTKGDTISTRDNWFEERGIKPLP